MIFHKFIVPSVVSQFTPNHSGIFTLRRQLRNSNAINTQLKWRQEILSSHNFRRPRVSCGTAKNRPDQHQRLCQRLSLSKRGRGRLSERAVNYYEQLQTVCQVFSGEITTSGFINYYFRAKITTTSYPGYLLLGS